MSDSEFEHIVAVNSVPAKPKSSSGSKAHKRKSSATRSDSEESVGAESNYTPKLKKTTQKGKPTASRSSASKKKVNKNPFDVFGVFPDEVTPTKKPVLSDPVESSITNRIPNGTTKRACNLHGDFFIELRVYNTADVRGELREERWKKALLAVKVQINDDSPEWEALQKFIKKIKVLFEDADVKFYSK